MESTRQLQDEFIGYLEDNYILSNKDDIVDFIFNEHPNLQGFLYDVTPLIKQKYPSNKLVLSHFYDIESVELSNITIYILYELDNQDIIQLTEELITFLNDLKELMKFHNVEWEFTMEVSADGWI